MCVCVVDPLLTEGSVFALENRVFQRKHLNNKVKARAFEVYGASDYSSLTSELFLARIGTDVPEGNTRHNPTGLQRFRP